MGCRTLISRSARRSSAPVCHLVNNSRTFIVRASLLRLPFFPTNAAPAQCRLPKTHAVLHHRLLAAHTELQPRLLSELRQGGKEASRISLEEGQQELKQLAFSFTFFQ